MMDRHEGTEARRHEVLRSWASPSCLRACLPLCRVLLIAFLLAAWPALASIEDALTERQKIEALIDRVESLPDAVFIRNGVEYDSPGAADHLRMKWTLAGDRIKTAAQFIERLATRSSRSGEAYMIRFDEGSEITSAEFLTAALAELESPRPPTSRPAASQPATSRPSDRAGDRRAAAFAHSVMERMGGQEAWDGTRYLTWNFFGSRRHLWDRATGDVRIEWVDRESGAKGESGAKHLVLMNLATKDGRAWQDGQEITDREALAELLDDGHAAWINDSYWLVMPYKLMDRGVTLKSLGERPMTDGRQAQVLELTFEKVGRTPQNKYHVYVASDTGLVEQWDFYAARDDAEPRFQIPWHDWKRYGKIMLSGDRGERRGRKIELTGIAAPEAIPDGALTSPAAVDWDALSK